MGSSLESKSREESNPVSAKVTETLSKSLANTQTEDMPEKDDSVLLRPASKQEHAHASDDNTESLNSRLAGLNQENVDEDKRTQDREDEMPPQKKIDICPICLDDCNESKELKKCGHVFCSTCIDQYFETVKPQCPCCFTIYGEIRGNQPENGTMTFKILKQRLPGFSRSSYGTLEITYHFPDGIQDERHPNPGTPYHGTTRIAYLPENHDGRHILKLLQKAFQLRQVFTVGQSRTTGKDNVVTWNDIHHKTSFYGGMESFGYPDDTYFNRVKQELAAKGIQ